MLNKSFEKVWSACILSQEDDPRYSRHKSNLNVKAGTPLTRFYAIYPLTLEIVPGDDDTFHGHFLQYFPYIQSRSFHAT